MSKTAARKKTRKTTKRSIVKIKEISVKLEFGDQCLLLKKAFWWPHTQHNQLAYEQVRDIYLFENDVTRLCIEIMPKTDGDRRVLMFRTKTAADCELLVRQLQQRKMFTEIYRSGNIYPVQYNQWKSVVPHNDNAPSTTNTREHVQNAERKVCLGGVEHFELASSDREFVVKSLGSFSLKKMESLDTQRITQLLADRSDKTLREPVILTIKTDSMTRDQGCWWADSDDRCLHYAQIKDTFHLENDQRDGNWIAVDVYLAMSEQRRLHVFCIDNYKEQRLLTAILKKRQIWNRGATMMDHPESVSQQPTKNQVIEEARKEDCTAREVDPRRFSTSLAHKHRNQGILRSVYREPNQKDREMNANHESSCTPGQHREIQDVRKPMGLDKNPQYDTLVEDGILQNSSLNPSQANHTTVVSCPINQFFLEHIDAFNVDPDENMNAIKVEDYLSRRQASHSQNKIILECIEGGLRIKDNIWWPKCPEITEVLCEDIKGVYPLSFVEPRTQFALDIMSDDGKHRRVHIFESLTNTDGNRIIQQLIEHRQPRSSGNLLSTEAPATMTHGLSLFSPNDTLFDASKNHNHTALPPRVILGSSTQRSPNEQPFLMSSVVHKTNFEVHQTPSRSSRRLQPKTSEYDISSSDSGAHSATRSDSSQILSQSKWKAPSPTDLIIQYDSETEESDTPVYILITNLSNRISPASISVSRKLPSDMTSDSEFQNSPDGTRTRETGSTSAFRIQSAIVVLSWHPVMPDAGIINDRSAVSLLQNLIEKTFHQMKF
ncbi:uncharacterized protein DEA37_0008981 [Paragonimus westermani]|uniref:Uncharacterized protein n=1 Tax=Paragonimus westermani TaxID=34504 RepID=A0A5J4P4A0_9TREM|nr:uncharacterized protein DEA37_0008981 [Paragonimus westermani]